MTGRKPGVPPRAAVLGVAGLRLEPAERALIQALPPLGFILFRRNCAGPQQVRALLAELRAAAGRPDAPVFIDQEGGRVMRLLPPCWPPCVPPRAIGALAERDVAAGREAAWLQARLIAHQLHALGIDVNCAPLLDLGLPGQTEAIGDRAFAADPDLVVELARATIEGLGAGGVLPVIKHLPGHGRASVDSHVALPVVETAPEVLERTDWRPFLSFRDAPFGMTAHVLYPALDVERPATLSATIVAEVIRDRLGFEGALLSDDLSMGALGGSLFERAAAARAAGCDLALHCNGDLDEMTEVLEAAGPLTGSAAERVARALAARPSAQPFDPDRAQARLDDLLAPVATVAAGG